MLPRDAQRDVVRITAASAGWTAVLAVAGACIHKRTSWHFFNRAARLTFEGGHREVPGGGLHVFAAHPKFQFGPVPVALAEVLRRLSFGASAAAASIVIAAMAPVMVWLLLDIEERVGVAGGPRRWWASAVVLALGLPLGWTYLSVYSLHLDDAVAITATVVALWALSRQRGAWVGVALGVACASKPWAVAFVPLVAGLPAGRRLRPLLVAGGIAFACWLPFLVGAPGTLHALGHFQIPNARDSALRALHVHARRTPSWDRAVQTVVGAAAGLWCARTGRWPAAVMAAVAVRMALDPAVHAYFTSGLVVAILAWELLSQRRGVPVLWLAAAVALAVPDRFAWSVAVDGQIRLAVCVVVLALALVVAGPGAPPIGSGEAGGRARR